MLPIDIKVKHKDPLGNKVMILTVRCGKCVATKVTEHLTTTLMVKVIEISFSFPNLDLER